MRDLSRPRGEHRDSHDTLLELKLAFDAEPAWLERLEQNVQPGALTTFLREVARVVPFYRDRLEAVPELALSAFPIVHRAQYIEDPRQFLMPPGESEVRSITSTNGTIGAPLAVTFDPVAWFDLNYGIYAMAGAVEPDLLDRMAPRTEGLFFVNNNPWFVDASTYVPPLNMALLRQLPLGRSADEDASLVAYLRGVPVPLLYGKASNLIMLAEADAAGAGDARIRPGALLVSGEALYDDQRASLERWFGCSVINAYLSTEGGLAAIDCPHRTGMHVCDDRVYLEVLAADGQIRETGRGQVLLTNLMNRGHVFIRYLLGDELELARGACACGFDGITITALHGRDAGQLALPGGPVPAATFEQFLLGLPLREFQVFQVADEPPWIKWVPATPGAGAIVALAHAIDTWLAERGWRDAVTSIPLGRITPPGGKYRRCVRVASLG